LYSHVSHKDNATNKQLHIQQRYHEAIWPSSKRQRSHVFPHMWN
jgi:hypothetical protein